MRGSNYTGRTLAGRYEVGERLGEGAWGAVYAAVQTDLGRKVAVKILHTDVALAEEGVARFQREARAAAALGHPNITQVTDFQSNPNEPPFLVMELLNGETLASVLAKEKRLPGPRVAAIAHQILSALDTAHRAGIVHRDVKPDNVFLVSMPGIDDFVKLLDFGIAKLSAESHAQLTDAGAMLGSPAFMAPEQVRNVGIDHRTDLYAVGATMYLALSGRFPFDQTSIHALLFAITEQKPPALGSIDPAIDPRLVAIVDRAMHKDSAGRFFSAAEMRGALEPLLASTSRPGMIPQATFPSAGSASGPQKNMTSVMSATTTPATVGTPPSVHASTPHPSAGPPLVSANGSNAMAGPPIAYPATPFAASGPMTPPQSPPIGSAPPGYPMPAPMPMPPHASTGTTTATAPPTTGTGAIIGLLIAVVVLLLLGGGALVFFLVIDKPDAKTAAVTGSASVTRADAPPTAAQSGTTPAATTTGTATSGATTKPKPGPTPTTTTTTTVDAGPNPAPVPVVTDAGPPVGKKQYAGATARYSGGQFNNYDIEKTKEAFAKVNPLVNACFAATEFTPPDHQFTYWNCNVDPAGNIISVARPTGVDPHPKLDPCVIAALRQMKVQALPGGGTFQIGFTSRTRDNP